MASLVVRGNVSIVLPRWQAQRVGGEYFSSLLVTRRVMPLGAALVFIVSLAAGATGEEMLGPLSGIQWLHYLLSLALLLLHRDRVVPLLAASR